MRCQTGYGASPRPAQKTKIRSIMDLASPNPADHDVNFMIDGDQEGWAETREGWAETREGSPERGDDHQRPGDEDRPVHRRRFA